MSSLPDSVIVGPYRYPIRQGDDEDAQLDELDCYAHFTGGTADAIMVHQGLSGPRERVGLFHECLHAMLEHTGHHHVLEGLKAPFDVEECVVLAFDAQIIQFLRDNPALVAYLTAEDGD